MKFTIGVDEVDGLHYASIKGEGLQLAISDATKMGALVRLLRSLDAKELDIRLFYSAKYCWVAIDDKYQVRCEALVPRAAIDTLFLTFELAQTQIAIHIKDNT